MKTRNQKTKAMSILLAIVMLLGMLPMTAFAALYDKVITITVDENGLIATDNNGDYPDGVELVGDTYRFAYGYSFIVDGKLQQTSEVEYISNAGEILSGEFAIKVLNKGVISGGTYSDHSVDNTAWIDGGTFDVPVVNRVGSVDGGGTISGGTFNSLVTNQGCTIEGGTFNGKILNMGGTVAQGVNGTVAQGGNLAITTQKLGGANVGIITVKQNGVDIPSGAAGQTYSVAGFDDTLVGLYLLRDGENAPTEEFSIDTVFEAQTAFGRVTQYDFEMPNEAVTIVAVFSDYTQPTTVDIYAMIAEGTSSDQLADGELLYGFEMPTVSGFENGKTLTVDTVGKYITVDGVEHMFEGFYYYSYDDSTETEAHSVSDIYEIGAEPADKESGEWAEWYAPISDGVYAVYISTGHSHSWAEAWSYNGTHHWHECGSGNCTITENDEKSGYAAHVFENDSDATCDCGYSRGTTDYITVFNNKVNAGQYFDGGSGAVVSTAPASNYLYYAGDGQITLNSFVYSNMNEHAIISKNKNVSIILNGQNNVETDDISLAINDGRLNISGDGSLSCNDYIDCGGFELTGGTVTCMGVSSVGDIIISDGELIVPGGDSALKAMNNHNINISGGKITGCTNAYGLYCVGGDINISGGELEFIVADTSGVYDRAISANTLTIGDDMKIVAGSSKENATEVASYNGERYVKIVPRHTHSFGTEWVYNNENHWHACSCGEKADAAAHDMKIVYDGTNHWHECSCGRKTDEAAHDMKWVYDDERHWQACSCGKTTNKTAHDLVYTLAGVGIHDVKCSCGYHKESESCEYEEVLVKESDTLVKLQNVCKFCKCIKSLVVNTTTELVDGGVEIEFIVKEGSVIPNDAELVIDAYKAGVEQIPGSQQNDLTSVVLTNDKIEIITDTSKTINGVTYTLYELIEINGIKYQIDSIHHDSIKLLNLDSGEFYVYYSDDVPLSLIDTHRMELVVLSETCKININGVEYDIVLKMTGKSKYDRWFLYYNGSPAGVYHSTNDNADFLKGYDPATLSGKQDIGDLGTITVDHPPVADLTAGTTYYVTVVGSNDIHLENAENISGTLTQTFDVPDALVGRDDVIFVAVHDKNPYAMELVAAKKEYDEILNNYKRMLPVITSEYHEAKDKYEELLEKYNAWEAENNSSHEYGEITISEDGNLVTATYAVDSFSPFIVYAFVEADEPEIKQLNATIHTEHIDADGDSKCDVCSEDYSGSTNVPGTVDPSDNPQTGDNSHMALWIALMFISGGAVIALIVINRKKRIAVKR